jgi:hypothetical protein
MMSLPLTVVLILASCSQRPEDTIQRVTDSFQKLEAMKAKDYAPEAFQQAEDAYADAVAEIEMQRQKTMLNRSYSRANELLAKAKEKVEQAVNQSQDSRNRLARDAGESIEEAKAALQSTESDLAKLDSLPPKKQDIRAELDNAAATLKEACNAFDSGDFLSARSKAEDAEVSIVSVQIAIEAGHGR